MADTATMWTSLLQRGCLAGALGLSALLAGCDYLGIEDPAKEAARKEADGKAIGSACRHALRAIEDCYTLNPKASRSAVYIGWKEMDEYMRENKLEGIVPVVPRPVPGASKPKPPEEDAEHGEAAKDAHGAEADKSGKGEGKADGKGDTKGDKSDKSADKNSKGAHSGH